jgi:isoleucyl-tRNA synthetase
MPDPVPVWRDDALEEKWTALIQVRDEVNKALEQARRDKVVGNSLGAHVELYPDENTRSLLGPFEDLETLFIVSKVTIHDFNARPKDAKDFAIGAIRVVPAPGEKCERCWIVTPEVGQSTQHPTLCPRCVETVERLASS